MAKNLLVISCDARETRVALIENGIIAELHIERRGNKSTTVGNVYLGKVTRVLPGLQAAFIDIGQERAAFLHVEDLIRPDDFEAYLEGARKGAVSEEAATEGDDADDELPLLPQLRRPHHAILPDEPEQEPQTEVSASPAVQLTLETVSYGSGPSLHSAPDISVHDLSALASEPESRPDFSIHPSPARPPDTGEGPSLQAKPTLELGGNLSDRAERDLDEGPSHAGAEDRNTTSDTSQDVAGASARDLDEADDALDLDGVDSDVRAEEDDDNEERDEDDLDAEDEDDEDDLDAEDEDDEDEDEDDVRKHTHAIDDESDPVLDAVNEGFTESESLPPPAAAREAGRRGRGRDRKPKANVETAVAAGEDDLFGMPGFTVSEPGEEVPKAPSPGRGRRGKRRRDGGREGREGGRESGRGERGRRQKSNAVEALPSNRISKTTPIREVVREGQDVIVQITKDPISTKGARCSSHISLPGRYVVYLPTVEHLGISKRIGSEYERARLREVMAALKPKTGGLVVRTLAEGLTKKHLKQDIGYLMRLWTDVAEKRMKASAPALLASELDLVLKVARDLFTDAIDRIIIDDRAQYERLVRFLEAFAPEKVKSVELYAKEEPLFDAFGIEDEIRRALSRKVPLPSGGYLVIDEAEALTAIDVNTGRFVGKNSKDMEDTIVQTNLEAVEEIAYQLRFRNIGGLIILDLIDMEKAQSREKVRRRLEDVLEKDKAKTTLNRISELGLIEMTRKRTRESLGRLMNEPCFYCDGTGHLQSKDSIVYDILREIRRKRKNLPGYTIQLSVHPAVADLLAGSEKAALQEVENKYMRKIHVLARKDYHLEQFDIAGK
jgi:ribonuclease G